MAKLMHEIQIHAPIEAVWGILVDLEQVSKYNPLVSSAKYTSENKTGIAIASSNPTDMQKNA